MIICLKKKYSLEEVKKIIDLALNVKDVVSYHIGYETERALLYKLERGEYEPIDEQKVFLKETFFPNSLRNLKDVKSEIEKVLEELEQYRDIEYFDKNIPKLDELLQKANEYEEKINKQLERLT